MQENESVNQSANTNLRTTSFHHPAISVIPPFPVWSESNQKPLPSICLLHTIYWVSRIILIILNCYEMHKAYSLFRLALGLFLKRFQMYMPDFGLQKKPALLNFLLQRPYGEYQLMN